MKHIHFIGICGVAMSALAIAFQKLGYKVTGSDKGFYPPVSDNLKNAGINFYPGWHPEKMGMPDLVVVGNVAGSKNSEWLHVQEKNISYKSYPEVIAEFLIAKNSIVCAGTYGKSTTTTLMSWILNQADMNPNYMFGGISLNNLLPAHIGENAEWSVVEGDEYKTSRWDTRAKFFHYSPTHLLLTSVVWDHADVYPTEKEYFNAFQELVNNIPDHGTKVISEKALSVLEKKNANIISYGKEKDNNYVYSNIVQTKESLSFTITHEENIYNVSAPILGEYNADNITGCFALAHEIGIDSEKVIQAISTFKGMKRRFQKRSTGSVDVYDDIAHSPSKARAMLASVKKLYTGNIIAVFEPNTGNRELQSKQGYKDAFVDATEVIIPRLTKLKIDPNNPVKKMDGQDIADLIPNATYIDDDEKLVNYIASNRTKDDVIVFLGSHSFRNMIEQTVKKLL